MRGMVEHAKKVNPSPVIGWRGQAAVHYRGGVQHMSFEQSVGLLIASLSIAAFGFLYRSGKGAIWRIQGAVYGCLFALVAILEAINIAYGQGVVAQWQVDSAQTVKLIRENHVLNEVHFSPMVGNPVPAWVFELILLVACTYLVLTLADVLIERGAKGEAKDKAE
jgi:hypothetical protein